MTLLKQIEITVQIQESNSPDTFILAEDGGICFNLELPCPQGQDISI